MKLALYLIQLAIAIPLNIIAILGCWFIALFVNKNTGQLPYFLKWFETPDTDYQGFSGGLYDELWILEHPTWSKYKMAYTWCARNPAYGFNMYCAPYMEPRPLYNLRGNINIADGEHGVAGWYLLTIDGYFQLSFVYQIPFTNRCMRGDYGWNLKPIAMRFGSDLAGALLVTMGVRFYNFGVVGK